MKSRAVLLVSVLLALGLLSWMAGCDREEPMVTAPTTSVQPGGEDPGVPSGQVDKAYPPYSFSLNVPYLRQWPPGDKDNTKNCGQTCAVMLGGYYNNSPLGSTQITAQNTWLATYTGDFRFNQANGWYTSLYQQKALLEQKHNLHTSYPSCSTLEQLINIVASGKPCIVGVMIKEGNLVSSGGIAHWAIVVGWNGNVIVNDPGSSYGNHRSYSVAAFNASWATQGRQYMSVWR